MNEIAVVNRWPDRTWNPIRGCSPVSEGCMHCTAARLAGIMKHGPNPSARRIYDKLVVWEGPMVLWTGSLIALPEQLRLPLSVHTPQRFEVCSSSDLFHPAVPDEYIRDIFAVMMTAHWHTFYLFTKRVERMAQWYSSWATSQLQEQAEETGREWPPPNLLLGFSAENQTRLDERCGTFFACPAARRLILLEPLMGRVDLTNVECPVANGVECPICDVRADTEELREPCVDGHFNALYQGIDGVIVGCENGPSSGTRAMEREWVEEIRDQCQDNGVCFFYKQSRDDRGNPIFSPTIDGRPWQDLPA